MEQNNDKAIEVTTKAELIRPVVTAGELIRHHKEVTEIISHALEKGRDYGVVPGTDRPTLLKPGAERLAIAFGCSITYELIEQESNHEKKIKWTKKRYDRESRKYIMADGESEGLYRYVVRCRLIHRHTGAIAGEGIGSCSTLESRYVDRPRDLENTVLKMAQKRALVAATLNAFGLSDRFTQDVEDMDLNEAGAESAHVSQPATDQKVSQDSGSSLRAFYERAQRVGVSDAVWTKMLKDLGITRSKETQTQDRLDKLESIIADWEAAKS